MGSDSASTYPLKEFLRRVFRFIFAVLSRLEVLGSENVPAEGGVLTVSNHLSYADPPLLFVTFPRHHEMIPLVADTYKKNPFFRWLVNNVGGVWINRGAGDLAAVKTSLAILKENKILGMAPEGTRSKHTHALQVGKTGAAFLASKSGVSIVPVGIIGTEKAWSELKRLRRPAITVIWGRAFTLPPLEGENKSALLEHYTHEIMCQIAALLPEEYHGVYKGEARIKEIRETGK